GAGLVGRRRVALSPGTGDRDGTGDAAGDRAVGDREAEGVGGSTGAGPCVPTQTKVAPALVPMLARPSDSRNRSRKLTAPSPSSAATGRGVEESPWSVAKAARVPRYTV